MQEEEEGTQRGDGIRRRYGGKHGEKKGKVWREKGHYTTCAHFILQKTEEGRPADDRDGLTP